MAVIQGRLDLMPDGKVAVEPSSLLPLEDEVLRLTRMVADLRNLSLAEVGGPSLHVTRVALGELLDTLVVDVEPAAAAKEIALNTNIPDNLPAVEGDGDRLRQVFFNLLANAIQYTNPEGRVTLEAWPGDDGRVHVQICDTGPGIAPEDLPHIFNRFYRVEKSRSRTTGGNGLGLAIVQSLVELHGGKVAAENRLGEGACFTVTLPDPHASPELHP